MNLDIGIVFSNLVGLFLIIVTGFLAVRLKVVPAAASPAFSALLLKIALPCTIFTSMLRPFDPSFLTDSLIIALFSGGMFVGNWLVSVILARLFRVREDSRGVWSLVVTFCNNGFMGFPIAYALFGDDGLALAAMIGIPFNLLLYSLGAALVCKDVSGQKAQPIQLRRVLLTPINGAVALGIAAYATQATVPAAILGPIQFLGNITTPLSMFVTGMALAAARLLDIVRDKDVFSAAFSRLLLLPMVAYGVMRMIPFANPLIPGVTLIILAMPSPGISATLTETYGGNRDLAARATVLSSLLCIVTIPIFAMLL